MASVWRHPMSDLSGGLVADIDRATPWPHAEPAAADIEAAGLCASIRNGDSAAFERLFDDWFDRAVKQAGAFSGRDEAFCSDAVQEAFVRVIRGLPALTTKAALDAWLSKAVRSAVIDALRSEVSRTQREARTRDGVGSAASSHDAAQLEARIDLLNDEDRSLVVGRFGWGLSLDRLGRLAGLSADAVHGRIRRALAVMRAGTQRRDK